MQKLEFRDIKRLLHENYEDGCELAATCWHCPLSECRFEDPTGFLALVRAAQGVKRVRDMKALGLTVRQASQRFGVVERTMYRDLRDYPARIRETNPQDLAALLEYLDARDAMPLQGRLFA